MKFKSLKIKAVFAVAGVLLTGLAGTPAFAQLSVTGVGRFDFSDASGSGAAELSGLTYIGGNNYLAIGDNDPNLYTLTIDLNATSAAITSASIASTSLVLKESNGSALAYGPDREGVAYDWNANTVWVVDEGGGNVGGTETANIREFNLSTGNTITGPIVAGTSGQLAVFSNIVRSSSVNRGWESMALSRDGNRMWTANEDSMPVDGAQATTSNGGVVRLQRFNNLTSTPTPDGQWAYQVDEIPGGGLFGSERGGLVDLLEIPDGTSDGALIAIERHVSLSGFTIRLYEVDFTGATDITTSPFDTGLSGETYTAVGKTLLEEVSFGLFTDSNFENLTLGPQLDNGDFALLMAADINAPDQSLYSFRISGVVIPEPATGLMLVVGLFVLRRKRLA